MATLPRYLDGALAAYRAGQTGRDIHLGWWDGPPAADDFTAAQAALTRQVLALADVPRDARVLDVACGLGGTLQALGGGTGVNIDPRQLHVCRTLAVPDLRLVAADACALPFGPGSFDQVLCIEAMFHFRARSAFLTEAARVLRPGGVLTVTDILAQPCHGSPWPMPAMEAVLLHGYGPWPELWVAPQGWLAAADQAGLALDRWLDWTDNTQPSYRVIAPGDGSRLDAGQAMRWLHGNGALTYAAVRLTRR